MHRRRRTFFKAVSLIASTAAVTIAIGSKGVVADDSMCASTAVDDSWNTVFDRHDGWTGADCAGTVDLRDGRALWLFGDTWISSIRGGRRLPGATMVHNSIAIHPIDRAAPWKTPNPASVRFLWGPNNAQGKPTAWAVPVTENGDRPAAGGSREWLWANGGGLAVDRPGGSRRLFVFFFHVGTNPFGKGVWTFTTLGTTLGVVENATERADRWKLRLLEIPYSPQSKPAAGKPAEAKIMWGMAACLDPDSPHPESPDALIYGTRKSGFLNDALVLARAPAARIDQFQTWRFYAGNAVWSTEVEAAKPIADGLVSEFSVERMGVASRPTWILVQSEPLLGKHICVRTAQKPVGPWSARSTVATVSDVERSRFYFTYAAKGHSILSRPGELLITYLVNSQQFGDLVHDTSIYRPKFLRLPLSAISPPQTPHNR
jgi:uncharacterized protein DUF4185